MKARWGRSIGLGVLGAILLLALYCFLVKWSPSCRLYPLKEVLWVVDTQGKYHPPQSDFTKETCNRLKSSGLDVEVPKYEPYVLINAGLRDDSPDIEPMLILNWQPPGRE